MAENEKQAAQAEQSVSTDKKQETEKKIYKTKDPERVNRQINYFVMRTMWQIAHGRGGNTIYSLLTMSRERFTRVIELGTVKYRKGEAEKLASILNVSTSILEGKVRFGFFTKNRTDKEEITEKDWARLFALRRVRAVLREEMHILTKGSDTWKRKKEHLEKIQELYAKQRDDICKRLKEFENNGYTDKNLNQLYQLMKRGWTNKDACLCQFDAAMNSLDINILEACKVSELQKLKHVIAKKNQLITALIIYKQAKK